MQALNVQIDMKLASTQLKQDFQTSVQGLNSGYQDGSSFRKMLEEAQSENTTEGKNNLDKDQKEVLEKSSVSKDGKESQKLEKENISLSKIEEASSEEESLDVNNISQDLSLEDEGEVVLAEMKSRLEPEFSDFFALAEEDADIPDIVTELSEDVALFEEEKGGFTTDEILVAVMTGASVPKNTENVKEQLLQNESALSEITLENADLNALAKDVSDKIKNKKLFGEDGKIIVEDLRTEKTEKAEESSLTKEALKDGRYVASASESEESQITFTYSKVPDAQSNTLNVDVDASKALVKEGNAFSNMLAKQIENQASEIVKSGSLILKDGGKGSINLILHPEKLGNIKVKLEMSENIITGKILVQSEEAYNALKSSLPVLKAAFSESGFDAAGFDLSWTGNHNNGGSEESDKNPQWFKYAEDQMRVFDGDYSDYESSVAYGNDFYGSSRISVVA